MEGFCGKYESRHVQFELGALNRARILAEGRWRSLRPLPRRVPLHLFELTNLRWRILILTHWIYSPTNLGTEERSILTERW